MFINDGLWARGRIAVTSTLVFRVGNGDVRDGGACSKPSRRMWAFGRNFQRFLCNFVGSFVFTHTVVPRNQNMVGVFMGQIVCASAMYGSLVAEPVGTVISKCSSEQWAMVGRSGIRFWNCYVPGPVRMYCQTRHQLGAVDLAVLSLRLKCFGRRISTPY